MKEILFRGKRVDNGEWVEGGIIPLDVQSGYVYIVEPFLSASTLSVYEIIKHHMHLVIPETVGQYTGLTSNGTKIFEGDIVQVAYYNENRIRCYVVEMSEKRGGWFPFATDDGCGCCSYEVCSPDDVEIIGNTTDNPELLGGAE